jgi:hypothetical protein
VQLGILAGVYSRKGPDFDRSYPINLTPYVNETGISKGYLRSSPGVTANGTGEGPDRGGINWNGNLYRVSGTKVIKVGSSGASTVIGSVGGMGQASLTFSFDRLAIASNLKLFYVDAADVLTQVTDIDLGNVVDVTWQDGYFITTDGTSIVLTDLNDPTSVNPLAYGSAEADPDPIRGLLSIRGELYACGGETIEVFYNTGDAVDFPFQRQRGAQIDKGIVGTYAKCLFLDTFAFCGSGRNERPRIYLAGQGSAVQISDVTIERALSSLSDDELSTVLLESRIGEGVEELLVHLPCTTFVYSQSTSKALQLPVWYRLGSGNLGKDQYRPRNFVLCYDQWNCGDASGPSLGLLDYTTAAQFGDIAGWRIDAQLVYSEGKGAVCHEIELIGQYGRALSTDPEPKAFMSWTDDGLQFSQERTASLGNPGDTLKRPSWRRNGMFRNWRAFRFRGASRVPFSIARLEAKMEPLGAD